MQQSTRTVEIGVIGLGTVGGGVVRLIAKHHDNYLTAYGIDVRVRKACARHPECADALGLPADAFTTDWREVTADPDIDIVVEVIGGEHPATEIFEDAITHKKHVVSANKALLGRHVDSLAGQAARRRPDPLRGRLRRRHPHRQRARARAHRQRCPHHRRHRERNHELHPFAHGCGGPGRGGPRRRAAPGLRRGRPTADVDGHDAAAKLAILSSIAFRTRITTDDVRCQGIRNVSAADIEQARELGMKIKLLAVGRKTAEGVEVRVHPAMIPATHQLAAVGGAMNAVLVVGDAVGETMFYGAGAGAFPTASAVVGDILELARPLCRGERPAPEAKPFERTLPVRAIGDASNRFYIRLTAEDRTEVLAAAVAAFAEAGVPLSRVDQLAIDGGGRSIAFITERALERDVAAACDALAALPGVSAAASVIRIEDVDAWSEGVEGN